MRTRAAMVLFAVAGGLLVPHRARAATITVNSTADNGPGNCTTTCTLRDAIATAAFGDTIVFSVVGTITLNGTEIAFVKSLTINGPGARTLTVSGANASRIFNHLSGTVTLTGLTLASANGPDFGGAILNQGVLNVANCTFSGNHSADSGGAIYNIGTLNVADSTFSGNSALSNGAIGVAFLANIAASTFSGNSATTNGGALDNVNAALTVTNSTFSGNSAPFGGGIHGNPGTTTTIQNSVFNSEAGGDCLGGSLTGTNNLSDGSCPGTLGTITGFDATLRNNGGPTNTFNLIPPSNAIDAASSCSYPAAFTASIFNSAIDQRGIARPIGPACDIGAVEAFAFSPASLPGGAFGISYSQTISVSAGGTGPFTFVESGALPSGITLSSAGLLSGTPTQSGSFPIVVTATDSNGFTGEQAYTLVIAAPTSTPTNTPTSTPTSTATSTPTNTPTSTPTNTPTNTPIPIPVVPTLDERGLLIFGLLVAGAGLLLLIRRR